ncbi:hypothetical protein A2U01_0111172, partial [Trifolium medium]|nr:hypothetical protein [Trifolium medium]
MSSLFSPSFSNNSWYIMSHELPWSIRILDTSWWAMVAMTIKGNISFGVPPGYSSSLKPSSG